MKKGKTNYVTQQQLKFIRGGRGVGHVHTNLDTLESITQEKIERWEAAADNIHPYISLERIQEYLYRITFDALPEDNGGDNPVSGGCSSYVKDGKLYRNLDFNYDNAASFIVRTKDFIGMSFITGLDDGDMDDEKIVQLPYRIVDGQNNHGIMVSTHVLFNDWEWTGTGDRSISLTRLPFLVLSRVKSMATIADDLDGVLDNLYASAALQATEYLIQVLVTDGTTTYALMPPTSAGQPYVLQNITAHPKLANFRWVDRTTVVRTENDIQRRPTGIERYNAMPCPLEDLRFTKCYESTDRLSEFIGIDDTTKSSTDAQLTVIYNKARAEYLDRERDGVTWQTMHSVVYGDGMESLHIQENWDESCPIAHTHSNRTAIDKLVYDPETNTIFVGSQGNPVNFAAYGSLSSGGQGQGGHGGDGILSIRFNGALAPVSSEGEANLGTLTTGTQHTALVARVEALENAPAGGVTSFNGRVGAVALTSGDVEEVLNISAVEKAVQALQGQIDSVASRDNFDELHASVLTADIVSVSSIYGRLYGTADYATTAGSASANDVYAWAKAANKPSYSYGDGYLSGFGALAAKSSLEASDIPALDASKITSGTFADARIASAETWNDAADKSHTHSNRTAIDKLIYDPETNTIFVGSQGNPVNFAAYGSLSSGGQGQGGHGGDGILSIRFNDALAPVSSEGEANLGTLTTGAQHTALVARVEALENAPAGGVTSFNGRVGAVALTSGDVEAVLNISTVEKAVQALQAQIDSVASRDNFDEIHASVLAADIVSVSSIYGRLYGTADYATTAGSAPASDVYSWAKAANKPSYSYGDGYLSGFGALAAKSSLEASDIPSLDASKITSGTFDSDRIPSLAIAKISGLQSALDGKQATISDLATIRARADEGHTAYNDLTTISLAVKSLQSQIDSVASKDFSEMLETLISLKMWIEDMFEMTSVGIHTKYLFYADGGLASGR